MKRIFVLAAIIGMGYLALNLKPVDFMSTACRVEAEALQERSERINHDLLVIRDTYTVSGHPRPGAFDEVKRRQDRYLSDLDDFGHRCN